MTPSKKLFIAATLLAAGYGLATLLGAPDPRLKSIAPTPSSMPRNDAVAATPQTTSHLSMPNMVGSVRLLPDVSNARAEQSVDVEAHAANIPANVEILALTSTTQNRLAEFAAEPSMPLLESRLKLHATLKDESPRPLPDEGRSARKSPANQVDATTYAQAMTSDAVSPASHVWPAGFTTAGAMPAENPPPSTSSPPLDAVQTVGVSPPPWPAAEPAPPRTHVIVDGDSLAKLAGRYLDDPRRSEEIFVLNRAILSDPDLLPIGAELMIPAPGGYIPTSYGATRQGTDGATTSVHSTPPTGLVPVRPVPATSGIMPRAQLLRPLPVE